jgi:hypothetical protein
MSTGWPDAQRIIAITQVARGGPGKDAAKLHDCGAITDGPPFSGLCRLLDGPLTCGVAILMVLQPCRQSTVLAAERGHMTEPYVPEDLARMQSWI